MNIQWNATEYKNSFSFVPQYGESAIALLKAPKGSLIVDLGCGNGSLSALLEKRGYRVVGVDDSEEMLSLAKKSYPNITFQKGNAVDFKFPSADGIFSNAVLHWIDKDLQQSMLNNIALNLKLGGEFVFEMGAKDCACVVHTALKEIFHSMGLSYDFNFFFPTIGEYAPMVEKAGLVITDAFYFPRNTRLEGTLGDWIRMFDTYPFRFLDLETKNEIISECEARLKATLFVDNSWYVDYTRLRMSAIKK